MIPKPCESLPLASSLPFATLSSQPQSTLERYHRRLHERLHNVFQHIHRHSASASSLVVVNPHKYVSSSVDSVLHKYAAEDRDATPGRVPLPPHIFPLIANDAYYHMRRTWQDWQSILFSGKYENHRPAIKPLDLSVSNPGKKDPNLQNQDPLLISSLKYSETHAHFQSEYFPFQKFIDRGRLRDRDTRLLFRTERNCSRAF